jgi:hypothetical protein
VLDTEVAAAGAGTHVLVGVCSQACQPQATLLAGPFSYPMPAPMQTPVSAAAKAYLHKLKSAASAIDNDDDAPSAFLSDQLQAEAKEAAGRALRSVGGRVNPPEPSSLGEGRLYGEGRLLKGHKLAATAVTLAPDDATAFTVTKCGSVLVWDVETSTRYAVGRGCTMLVFANVCKRWLPQGVPMCMYSRLLTTINLFLPGSFVQLSDTWGAPSIRRVQGKQHTWHVHG